MKARIAFALAVTSAVPALLAAAPATQPSRPPSQTASSSASSSVTPSQALSGKLPEIKFDHVTFEDAIDFLRDASAANIHVNWRALEAAGIDKKTPVTMQLNQVPMRRVLRSLLEDVAGARVLTYYVDDNVIEVTTRELADSQLITRVYPVDDLVMAVPNFIGPSFNLENQSNQTSGGGGGGGGGGGSGQSLFSGNGGSGASGQDQETQTPTKQQRGDELVKTIEQSVQPDIWRDNGGVASIRYFNGKLIVTAPRSVQQAIAGGD